MDYRNKERIEMSPILARSIRDGAIRDEAPVTRAGLLVVVDVAIVLLEAPLTGGGVTTALVVGGRVATGGVVEVDSSAGDSVVEDSVGTARDAVFVDDSLVESGAAAVFVFTGA